MEKQTLSALTIAVVLTPLTVLTQKIQRQQTYHSPRTETTENRTKQAINHNAYDLSLEADAAISLPEARQFQTAHAKFSLFSHEISQNKE